MSSNSERQALGAIALWSTLAPLGSLLGELPSFFVTGVGLIIGSTISMFMILSKGASPRISLKALGVGVFGLFGYHAALFTALQLAPAVQANLVNYLWPLLIVVLAPLFLPGASITWRHLMAGVIGFAGAGLAITSGGVVQGGDYLGYGFALLAAVIWATYSLATKRLAHFQTAAVGVMAFVSGLLALGAHLLFESAVAPNSLQWGLLVLLGFGPLGGAFYLWDSAIKHGDPQRIGLLSFLTPLFSTTLLLFVTGKALTLQLLLAGVLIIGAAYFGTRSGKSDG